MARGNKAIPLLVAGSLDTKTNPKLVRPGSLLELENMYQVQTGRMIPRNGYSRLSATDALGTGANLFVTQNGGLGSVSRNWKALTSQPMSVRYGASLTTGWENDQSTSLVYYQYPVYTALVTGIPQPFSDGATVIPSIDPDMMELQGYRVSVWTSGTGFKAKSARDTSTGRQSTGGWGLSSPTMLSGAAVKCASTATSNLSAILWADAATSLNSQRYNSSGTSVGATTITAAMAASQFFDVKAIPGTALLAVAFKAAAGGVTCCIFNPATGAITSTVNTAGADASFALAWMDDQLSTGNMYLVTAGSGAGVVVRTMSATTMVVSATNVIDATATANIRNVTGHLVSSATNYMVLWDVTAANPYDDLVKQGRWTGAATVVTIASGFSLYSRSYKFPDGNYHVLLTSASTVQPGYQLIPCDQPAGVAGFSFAQAPSCVALSGDGAGRRQASSLATPVTSGSSVVIPVSRNRKVSTPTGDTNTGFKTVVHLTFTAQTKFKARELGGTVFIPGGVLHMDDGAAIQPATFPFYPEAPTMVASAAGGSMTASGTYAYRVVYKFIDATGRLFRSAASVTASITLGAGDNRVTHTYLTPCPLRGEYTPTGFTEGFGTVFAEFYRRGPAASGASLYNKVGDVFAQLGTPITFVDTMSDANAALGEAAYFNGNTLENFNPPSHSLLEVNGNRVGIVSAEDPTEFWYSKEYKAGAGIGFNPLLKLRISGDGAGGMTALAAMDGRWILFKKTAIYVVTGDGPNDLGQGSFNAPQAVSRTIGTTNPSSVIETPDGIMFQASAGGIWLLDRGLNLTYIGAPIEAEIIAATVTGAALVSNLPLVRFVTQTGRLLEWDYFHKRWYRHQLRTNSRTVVDCANSALHGWCYLLDDGTLMQESTSAVVDTMGTTTPIVPIVSFPHIQLAGLAGYQRLHALEFTIDVLGDCTLSVDAEYDFSGSVTGTPKTIALVAATTPTIQVEYNPIEGGAKCTSIRPLITVSGTPAGATFAITGATAYVAVKRGTIVEAPRRMT